MDMGEDRRAPRRFMTLRAKLLITLALISLTMAAITSVISYCLAVNRVKSISTRLSEQNTAMAGAAMTDFVEALQALSNDFMRGEALTRQALRAESSEDDRQDILAAAAAQTPTGMKRAVAFDFVAVYMTNGFSLETARAGALPFDDYESCVGHFADAGVLDEDEAYTNPRWGLCSGERLGYIRFIYAPRTLEKRGVAVFGVQGARLASIYTAYASGSFLMTKEGLLLSPANGQPAGTRYRDAALFARLFDGSLGAKKSVVYENGGREGIVSYYPLWQMRAYLVVPFEQYESMLNSEMSSYIRSVLIMAACVLALTVLLALTLSGGLSSSVTSLYKFMLAVGEGGLSLRYTPKGNDEIANLGERINGMLDQISLFAAQREKALMANQVMELQLMQQQINPHLLYNTLDAVLWVIQQNRMEDAEELILSLSQFFRISLSRGRELIPMRDELLLIDRYLVLQRLARKRDITLTKDVEEGLPEHPIIKLTLQPLVENAVLHGFAGYRENGTVHIRAWHEGDDLYISVQDNGIGMMESEVERVRQALQMPERPEDFPHFGLYNINRRIVNAFGAPCGLTIESELSAYTRVTLRLPFAPGQAKKEDSCTASC